MNTGVLSSYRVLDFTGEAGALCVKTLADMGAEIVRISQGKPAEREKARHLVEKVDILLETSPPGYLASRGLGYRDLCKINPGLIMVSITPFGQDGLYRDCPATDLTLQALGGWLSVTGEPRAPLKLYGHQAYNIASLFAANGTLLALRYRHRTGQGQHIDISIMECVAATLDHALVRYYYEGIVAGRRGSRHWNNAFEILPCADGYVLVSLHLHWETLVAWLDSEGMAGDLADRKWREREERNRGIEHVIEVLEKWTIKHKAAELVEKGQLMRFPWAVVATPGQAGQQEGKDDRER
jgi:crotonobetainyl-CoA:carnitine CoA-transferase CaiB-like acyl-CoA transferase